MKFRTWNASTEKWNTARLTQGPRYFKSNAVATTELRKTEFLGGLNQFLETDEDM
jgi:hypothetical protein